MLESKNARPPNNTVIRLNSQDWRGLETTSQNRSSLLLVYPKEENKNQTSEATKLELQTRSRPKQMKLQINRISKIRNGGIALELPIDQAEELDEVLKQKFETRALKISKD